MGEKIAAIEDAVFAGVTVVKRAPPLPRRRYSLHGTLVRGKELTIRAVR